MRLHAVALGVLAVALLSGCLDVTFDRVSYQRDTVVVRFTLVSLDNGTHEEANPGPHCGSARMEGARLRLERGALEDAGNGILLIVFPELEGSWSAIGQEGYITGWPHEVGLGIPDETQKVARLSRNADGRVLVDGTAVGLPYEGLVRDDGGRWAVTYLIDDGPGTHKRFTGGACF